MIARRLMLGAWLSGILLVWIASPLRCEAETPPGVADDPDKVITSLQQIASDLTAAVKRFQANLDREIALHDHGYRSESGRRIYGADADLTGGPADLVQVAIRKLFAARMISARRPGYAPPPLADADRIQVLIAEARSRLRIGNDTLHRLLVVSAKVLTIRTEAEQRLKLHELLKARNAAREAAKKAFVALPVALPEADSREQQREMAWDLLVAKLPVQQNRSSNVNSISQDSALHRPPQDGDILPVRFEEGRTITLVNEHFCLVTLTDSGMEDGQGRRLFYQEEWVTRPGSLARTTGTGPGGIVISMRWAVAVNTKTGQHTLLRRYEEREFRGSFEELYQFRWSDYISNAELPEISAPPSMQDLTSAVVSVERSRDELRVAAINYKREIREALTRNDALLAAQDRLALDDELPNDLRENLFAIRSRLGHVTAILVAENKVRRAAERAAGRVQILEALLAWVNGRALERESPAQDSRMLLATLNRSDTGIYLTRSLEREALLALPPEISTPESRFPALMRDVIVRIKLLEVSGDSGGTVRCKQEVWRRTASLQGVGQVKRTIVRIDIESKTGSQIPTGKDVKYYLLEAGDAMEEIYDQ
jgi:hypothetical protein